MEYNLAGIRERVRLDKLDDPEYDAGVIDRFINDTQKDIFNRTELPFAEKMFTGTLPMHESTFVMPTDLVLPQMLILSDPSGQGSDISDNYHKFRDFFRSYPAAELSPEGRPTTWTLHGSRMYFNVPTDQEYILKVLYLKSPDRLVNAEDVPEVPDDFEEALVLGAHYRVHLRNEDYDLAAGVKAEYLEQLDTIVLRLGKRQLGKPSVMGQPSRMAVRRR